MIVRSWRGATRAGDAEAYLDYLRRTGIREYRATPGNRGVVALRRLNGERAEWELLSFWDSPEAEREFAGPDATRAKFYGDDHRWLVQADAAVEHYEAVFSDLPPAPARAGILARVLGAVAGAESMSRTR